MHRVRNRWLPLVATAALLAALLPASPASGAVVSEGGTAARPSKAAALKLKTSKVVTDASSHGVRVHVLDLASDVSALDFYRSSAAGVEGDKLNSDPVKGQSFLDSTAEPGATYFYTVKVAARGRKLEGRFRTPDALPQVKSGAMRSRTSASHRSASKVAPKAVVRPWSAAHVAKARVRVSASTLVVNAAKTYGSGVQTLTANTVWTTAMSPIYVRGDLVVPAGKTLTIQPGVKVYFDIATGGNPADVATKNNPTDHADLVVHGTLIANGTASAPIVFSSVRSLAPSATTDGLPAAGDWGSIFCDSHGASSISNARVEYGRGVWAKSTTRPYVSNSVFNQTGIPSSIGDSGNWNGAILFDDPVGDALTPRVKIWGNTIATPYEGIVCYASKDGTSGGNAVVDPWISGNTINAEYCVDLESWHTDSTDVSGGSYVKGSVTGNKLYSPSWAPVYLWSDAYGGRTSGISTAFSNNTITSLGSNYPYSEGVYGHCYQEATGAAQFLPTFSGDKISAYEDAVYGDTESTFASDTAGASVVASPKFTNCTIASEDYTGVELYAEASGKGNAICEPVFAGGSLETASTYGIYDYASSHAGSASASPQFTNVTGKGHDSSEFIYAEAETDLLGLAKADPKYVGGSIVNLDDSGIYAYADSDYGNAEAKPYLSGTSIASYTDCVEAYAYGANSGGTGYGDVSGSIINSKMWISEHDDGDSVYYGSTTSNGNAPALASPIVSGSNLFCGDYQGLELYATSRDGLAAASPVITNSSIRGLDSAVYAETDRVNTTATISADAVSSPKITNSTLVSDNGNVVELYADNNGTGNSFTSPVISGGTIVNDFDDGGVFMYPTKSSGATGTAQALPVMTSVKLRAMDYYAVHADPQGPGSVASTSGASFARFGGTFTGCTFDNPYYDAIDSDCTNYGGKGALTNPAIINCIAVTPDDNAYDLETYGSGTGDVTIRTAPFISGGSAMYGANGIYLRATDEYTTGTTETVLCDPTIKNIPVYATWDQAIETRAENAGDGTAVNNSLIQSCPTYSYDGILCTAEGHSGLASATNSSKVLGTSAKSKTPLESYDDNGVYSWARSQYGGTTVTAQAKYLNISAYDSLVDMFANSDALGETAVCNPSVQYNGGTNKWLSDSNGIDLSANAFVATCSPNVSYNSLPVVNGQGINVGVNAAVAPGFAPYIFGNAIPSPTGSGIYLSAPGTITAASVPYVAKNSITNPLYNGVYMNDVPLGTVTQNTINTPGFGSDSSDPMELAGVAWSWASPDAMVKGNMVKNARFAVSYTQGAPATKYNSFGDVSGAVSAPYNYFTDDSSSNSPLYDAKNNYWGTSDIAGSIFNPNYGGAASDLIDWSGAYAKVQPQVTGIGVAKAATSVKLTVTFDRPMDTAIKTLKFGPTAPYAKFSVTGTWNTAGTVFTGTFKPRSILPTGKAMFFSGAKDLPGNLMAPTSKSFKL